MSDLISVVVNAIVTVLASIFTIKFTLSNELKKMKYQYKSDDDVAIRTAYSKMRASVSTYLANSYSIGVQELQTAISSFVAIAPAALQQLLQELHQHVLSNNKRLISEDLQKIDNEWQVYLESAQSYNKRKK